jgi:hypothetical protein
VCVLEGEWIQRCCCVPTIGNTSWSIGYFNLFFLKKNWNFLGTLLQTIGLFRDGGQVQSSRQWLLVNSRPRLEFASSTSNRRVGTMLLDLELSLGENRPSLLEVFVFCWNFYLWLVGFVCPSVTGTNSEPVLGQLFSFMVVLEYEHSFIHPYCDVACSRESLALSDDLAQNKNKNKKGNSYIYNGTCRRTLLQLLWWWKLRRLYRVSVEMKRRIGHFYIFL